MYEAAHASRAPLFRMFRYLKMTRITTIVGKHLLKRESCCQWNYSSRIDLGHHNYLFGTRSKSSVPFYGEPIAKDVARNLSAFQRVGIALHSATTALADPTRADSVAALGEVTGHVALVAMRDRMRSDPTGRRLLNDKPLVPMIDMDLLSRSSSDSILTFGQAYASFMGGHAFDPEKRSTVKFIQDPDLAYCMLRYRQIHDFLHVLCNLPPTVLGELALKWVELLQNKMPVAALSVLFGPLQLNAKERHVYDTVYKPWAISTGTKANFLMNVYFEELLDQDLEQVRKALNITPAPTVEDFL